jgi:D-alanine transaminase/branched-chain amino acid aminotransferase
MSNWAFLNHKFILEEDAVLHIHDLSIQRGYGVFDFFKVVNTVPVFLEEHLDRFYFSAAQLRLTIDYTNEELKRIIFELLERNTAINTGVRITLTGGYSTDGFQLAHPNLIISLRSFTPPSKEQFEKGIRLMTYQHQRQLPHVKSIDYLMPIWLQPFIRQNDADDVLYHQNGIVTECPRSNFFIVTNNNRIITPSRNILKGVIRTKLIDTAKKDFEVEERDITVEEIKTAKEAFITSTTKIILPVRQVNEHIFSIENPVSRQLFQAMFELSSTSTHLTANR